MRNLAFGALAATFLTPTMPLAVPSGLAGQALSGDLLDVVHYRSIGPTRQSGRFVDVAVPEGGPYTFYIATGSGNLWKSENNGITFDVLFEDEDVFSIGDIAIAPSDPDVIYLGSGEANNSRSTYWGDGVYKSTDAGETWTNVGLPESHHIGRIVVHPTNPEIVYVAALGHLYSENEERGLYKSTDGGESWRKMLGPVVAGKHIGVVDVAMSPADSEVLYAATYDKVRVPFSFDLGGPGSRVYKSTDGGENWNMLENGLPGGMLGRIGVEVAPSNPDIVYLTVENANKEGMSDEERHQELLEHQSSRGMIGGEVYRSDDAGATWRKTHADSINIGGSPAYYYGQIRVDPNDPDRVFVLSVRTWVSEDGGVTWDRSLGFGGDDHGLWINPDDSNHMILGYDHGMGITLDGGDNWYHPDFQSLAQFYAVGIDMSRPYRVAGGLQDNGSHMAYHTNPAGGPVRFEAWERVGGGDGMYNEFDWCENRYLYNESQFGPIARTDLWTGEREGIRYTGEDDLRWNWNSPILVSSHDCDVIYHGSNKLLRSPNRGEGWDVISPDLSKADPATLTTGRGGDGNIQYATITTIAESPLDERVLWVGTDDGNVQVTRDRGESWTLLNESIRGNPGYWVSRVEASHHDPAAAYLSYTGYRRDDFRPFLYRTVDYGQTWTDISSNLPDEPINVVREHPRNPNLLFVGTEFAVYVSIDRGENWARMRANMPVNPVHDMKIHPRDDDLVVATHGRGIYIAEISFLSELTPAVLAREGHLFQPEDRIRWIADDRVNYASSNFNGESEPDAVRIFYYVGQDAAVMGEGDEGGVTLTIRRGGHIVMELDGPAEPGLHEVRWEMDQRAERTPEQIDQMVERARTQGREVDPEDVRWTSDEAPLGTYTVTLTLGDLEETRSVSILKDEWWRERR